MGNTNNREVFELLFENLLDEILGLEIDAIFGHIFISKGLSYEIAVHE